MVTERIRQITAANESLLSFLPIWEEHRHQPDVADFAFGNPQEMVIDGFSSALASATTPGDKGHYAYKFSEEESQRTVASHLTEWRGQEFAPEDIAMTPGAFGAIAAALGALVDVGDEVVYSDPPWFFYKSMILSAGFEQGLTGTAGLRMTAHGLTRREYSTRWLQYGPGVALRRIPDRLAVVPSGDLIWVGRSRAPLALVGQSQWV